VDHLREDFDILYGASGEFSVVIAIQKPGRTVFRFAASAYEEFHGPAHRHYQDSWEMVYLLQKQDVLFRAPFDPAPACGRVPAAKISTRISPAAPQLRIDTYLTITRQVKRGRFYVYDPKQLRDFRTAVS
jgi:hypothetical protein